MITVQHSKQLLDNKILTFTTSKEELSILEKKEIEDISIFNFKFDSNTYSVERKQFIKAFSELLIKKYNLCFFYIDKTIETKSKIRSFKKMMYPHKNQIGESNLHEYEITLDEGKTLLYSVIFVKTSNIDYISNHLLDSKFSFAYLTDKNLSVEDVLSQISIKSYLKNRKTNKRLIDLNILKVVQALVNENASVFKRSSGGKDNIYLSVFYKNKKHLAFMKNIGKKIKIMNI